MIFVISDDITLADNLNEILLLNGVQQTRIKDNYILHDDDIAHGVELIIYFNSTDPYGERLKWYLLANQLDHIPVIFLASAAPQNHNPLHKYIKIPFEINDISSAISHFFALR
ncbi:MAG: hypothetical protein ACPGJS_02105 [Flammeovirgaceae bacterium]